MKRETFITDFSLFSCLGNKVADCVSQIIEGRDGLTKKHRFDDICQAPLGEAELPDCPAKDVFEHLTSRMINELNETTDFLARYSKHKVGFLLGTTTLGVHGFQESVKHSLEKQVDAAANLGTQAQLDGFQYKIQQRFPIRGLFSNIVTSCSAGALAIAQANKLVETGVLDACIAGGIDLLTVKTIKGFESLQILAPEKCKPFQNKINGISLSDGGALSLIESNPQTKPKFKLLGSSIRSEAYHMTNPFPEGKIMERTMSSALERSAVSSADIDYICPHGTGTFSNDENEKKAIESLRANINFESLKAYIGHSLAGSGALELAIIAELSKFKTKKDRPKILKNSFGFGGSDASLVLEVI